MNNTKNLKFNLVFFGTLALMIGAVALTFVFGGVSMGITMMLVMPCLALIILIVLANADMPNDKSHTEN